jgi:hypothetical protein
MVKLHKCKNCKETFISWETKNGFKLKRICQKCFYSQKLNQALDLSKRWTNKELKHTMPAVELNYEQKPMHLTEDEFTKRFIMASDYLAIGYQKGLGIAYSTSVRTIRKWANKFFKERDIKRLRVKNTTGEPSFEKMIDFWEDKKIKDSDIIQFIEEFKLDKFNKNNPVNKAILCWNKQIESMSEQIKEQQNHIHSAWSGITSDKKLSECLSSDTPSTMIHTEGETNE